MRIDYRDLRPGEEPQAAAVAEAAFVAFIEPSYSESGAEEFRKYASATAIRARRVGTTPVHHAIVAEAELAAGDRRIVGVAEMRDWSHVSMLFVDPAFHRRGIGKALLARLLDLTRRRNGSVREVTVNSSPFAVPVYERYGFVVAGEPVDCRGLIFIPMRYWMGMMA